MKLIEKSDAAHGRVVISDYYLEQLKQKLCADQSREAHAFLFGTFPHNIDTQFNSIEPTSYDDFLINVSKMWVTPESAYTTRHATEVDLKREYIIKALEYARKNDFTIIDVHTHPWAEEPQYSPIDDSYGADNALWILNKSLDGKYPLLPWGMLLIACKSRKTAARLFSYTSKAFERCDIVTPYEYAKVKARSRSITKDRELQDDKDRVEPHIDYSVVGEQYDRQVRIWGEENQRILQGLRVYVAGAGGVGFTVAEILVRIGVNNLTIMDDDIIEASNVPRLIGATLSDVGRPKVEVLKKHLISLREGVNVISIEKKIDESDIHLIPEYGDVIIGAVDNDAARLVLNESSVRYLLPYIDIGTGILPGGKDTTVFGYKMGGQVQLINPGTSSCIVCSGFVDPIEAAILASSEKDMEIRKRLGYVQGTAMSPEASVLPLNSTVSSWAIVLMIEAIIHSAFKGSYLLVNVLPPETELHEFRRRRTCPVCGDVGYLGMRDRSHYYATTEELEFVQRALRSKRVNKDKE